MHNVWPMTGCHEAHKVREKNVKQYGTFLASYGLTYSAITLICPAVAKTILVAVG